MDFFNQLLTFAGNILVFAGGITAAIGVVRWISGGKSHDAQQQESSTWMLALGGAMIAIGLAIASGIIKFPSLS